MRLWLVPVLAFGVSGCLQIDGGTTATPVLRQAELAGGTVIVRPPSGYCVDAGSVVNRAQGGFALIGSCASLTGDASGVFVEPAIITISASPAGEGAVSTDSRDFQQALGRGRILRAINREGLALLQVEGGSTVPPNADQRHWRALMTVGDKVLGLALYGAPDSVMVSDRGMRLMMDLADAIRRDSPAAEKLASGSTPAAD
ncbi:hypothetical protein ACFQ3C_09270 [Seohaeicola saemankumensis]|uniref:Dihydroxy-acid dehydratase n=1 Tax=Seohaeicola saemankumensis TaxID=481181 RepID=A0ABW3TCU9_9RHOB